MQVKFHLARELKNMLYAIVIIVLMLIIFAAVYLHKAIQDKEATLKKRKAALRKLKVSLLEIDDVITTLKTYHGYGPLLRVLVNYEIYEYENILRKFPEDEDSKRNILELKEFESSIDEVFGKKFKAEIPNNDRQIAVFKRSGLKAIKMLKQIAIKGLISELEFSDYSTNLKTKMLKSEVEAFIRQGRKAENNEDHMSAAQYFKHAKDLLLSSDISYDEKTQDIKRISKMISGIYSTESSDSENKASEENSAEE